MSDQKVHAVGAKQFLDSEFGKHYLEMLSIQYNALHQEAEGNLSLELKAFKVERAAGVKVAIDYLTNLVSLLEGKHFDK